MSSARNRHTIAFKPVTRLVGAAKSGVVVRCATKPTTTAGKTA